MRGECVILSPDGNCMGTCLFIWEFYFATRTLKNRNPASFEKNEPRSFILQMHSQGSLGQITRWKAHTIVLSIHLPEHTNAIYVVWASSWEITLHVVTWALGKNFAWCGHVSGNGRGFLLPGYHVAIWTHSAWLMKGSAYDLLAGELYDTPCDQRQEIPCVGWGLLLILGLWGCHWTTVSWGRWAESNRIICVVRLSWQTAADTR